MALKTEDYQKEFNRLAQKAADEIETIIDKLFEENKFSILNNGDVMFESVYYLRDYQELDKKIFEIVKDTFIKNGWSDVELFNDSNIILRLKK